MEGLSKILFDTTAKSLDALFRSSKANLRIYNEKNIPKGPTLFVANHFTRIETIFFPYVLNKYTGKYTMILAHHTLFQGTLSKILSKLGAISTNNPHRDRLLISNLLTGDMATVIFPEGQMLKDKKIIEKGKYLIYNSGIRRPPHTGSARLALRAEFYREKLKYLVENKRTEDIKKYMEYFNLKKNMIEGIINQETTIVPVNITYYPIRAESNGIKRVVELFLKDISPRADEELSVEGSILSHNTDIDIHFGNPIKIRDYIYSSGKIRNKIKDNKLYLDSKEVRKNLPINRCSIKLMGRYMDKIYDLTTVNQDHLFAHILYKYPKNKINETDFKNRVNLAIEKIKKIESINFHVPIFMKGSLETDDFNQRYNDFIEAAEANDLIEIKDHIIYKNSKRLKFPYGFHFVRKRNIIEVIKNEIQPLREVVKILNRVSLLPARVVRRRIARQFFNLDRKLFEKDYGKYHIKGESKEKNIGSPFYLKQRKNKMGVILVHGYMAAPEEVRALGEHLHSSGLAVYGVRLRGHGTAPEDLAGRCWPEWYDSVNRAYVVMKNRYKSLAMVGFSAGGCLALLQAANKGDRFKAVVSINAPVRLQNIASHLASSVVAWNSFTKKIHLEGADLEFIENTPENQHINYRRNPIKGVKELGSLMARVKKSLGDIKIPALVIQGSKDPIVHPKSGPEIYNGLGSPVKEMMSIESSRHGIVNGDVSEIVFRKIASYLKGFIK